MACINKLLPFLWLCSFSLLTMRCVGDVGCTPEQRSSLLHVKHAFSFAEGDPLVSWIPGSNCCRWHGVTCLKDSRRSIELDLRGRGISGELPMDFFTLIENSTLLDLSDNPGLSGVLPDFPKSSALQIIKLSNTNLFGKIPNSVGNLSHLADLQLSGCRMSGVIPHTIGTLARLTTLNLSSNYFTGAIPNVFGNLSQLSYMDLSSNNFTGLIPSSTRNLTKLVHIDLSNNSLSGIIPVSLFCLPALVKLDISRNQLFGRLGEFPYPSKSLAYIDLNNNQLQGPIPRSLFQFSNLETLDLSSNNFNATLQLDMAGSLESLIILRLSHNGILVQEDNTKHLHTFPILLVLEMVSCNLTKLPTFLRYQTLLERLDLSQNTISGTIPKWIRNFDNLWYLNLSFNIFTHIETPIFPNHLRFLDLSSNMLQGPIPIPPSCIEYINYSNNNFSSIIPMNIFSPTIPFQCHVGQKHYNPYSSGRTQNMAFFVSIAHNSLVGEIPSSICEARGLIVLDLSENRLSGSIPPCLFESTMSLTVLKLRGNQLQESIPPRINEGCSLKALILNRNRLKGPLPRSLLNCSELEVLDLGDNRMAEPFPLWLGNLANLSVLILTANGFYGKIEPPENFVDEHTFSKLQIFAIASNRFNGSLPTKCFKNLKSMTTSSDITLGNATSLSPIPVLGRSLPNDASKFYDYGFMLSVVCKGYEFTLKRILTISYTNLDFSDNGFQGEISGAIGDLQQLHFLNFSHNALSGRIPPVMGNMKQLESLDLSANNLSGDIPQELTSLNFLSYLNLSNNGLTGRIPQGKQFSTFSDTSFVGNQGLCGVPLSKRCENETPWMPFIKPPSDSEGSSSSSTYVIGMALSIGSGFGVGFSFALVLINVPRKFWIQRE